MSKPRISIAMATFNGGTYLRPQLQSLAEQTLLPNELVICDDGSSDDTLVEVERFARAAPFTVRVMRNIARLGYARNFEKALSLCTGDLVFLCDQDDYWLPSKVLRIVELFAAMPDVQVIQSDMHLADKDLHLSGRTQLEAIRSLGFPEDLFITGCGTAIRSSWLQVALPLPPLAAHDDWISRLAIAVGLRYLLREPLQYYRRHDNNTSNWVASSLVIPAFAAFRSHGLSDATAGWRAELDRVLAASERIADRRATVASFASQGAVQDALNSLGLRARSLEDRLWCVEAHRLLRLPRIARLWRRGSYTAFSGWKSALKDLVRP